MAGLDPNQINSRLAEIHATLVDDSPEMSPAAAQAKALGQLEQLQRDIATVGHLTA